MPRRYTLLLSCLLFAWPALAQTESFSATLLGSLEVPANTSQARGSAQAVFNASTNTLSVMGSYTGLSAAISGSHVHLGAAGVNGSVILGLSNTGGTSGTFSGSGTLTAPQIDALRTQGLYINVHSAGTFSAGEVRGQLARAQAEAYAAVLSGANEVPANTSTASGAAQATFNVGNSTLSVTGSYTGLSAAISGSHVHLGAAGVNGSVILGLSNTGGTSGTFSGSGTLTAPQIDALRTQGLYINVHSAGTFSAGEVRGPLTLSSSPTATEETPDAGPRMTVAVWGRQVRFAVPETQAVRAELFDVLGRRVLVLFDGDAQAGQMQVVRVPDGVASGLYLVRLTGAGIARTAAVPLY